MVTLNTVRKLALSFPEVIELPHFEKTSFRVKKKIFATMSEKENLVMVKLSLKEQSVFCAYNKEIIYPVPGGWGKGGATYVQLKKVPKKLFQDALITAYCQIAPEKLARLL